MSTKSLLSLVARLQDCPAHETTVSRERFLECWDDLQREDVSPLLAPTLPVMAALILNSEDDAFGQLLNDAERGQLQSLVKLALDRYEQQTNPPNKLGRLLAGSIKKE